VGDGEVLAPAGMESPVGYHSENAEALTRGHELVLGHCQAGSLTGAVASQKVTEAPKGYLTAVGNRANRVQRHKVA
jgi:hypothetical protein